MANVQLNVGSGGALVASNPITRDGVTEQMELINIADPTSGTCAPVDASGVHVVVAGTPSVSVSNTPNVTINGTPTVALDGCTYLNVTDGTAHTVSAGKLVGFQNLDGNAQAVSITAYDGTVTTAPKMTAPLILGAGQIITFPEGGIKTTSGSITVQASGAPTTGIQLLYHA